MAKYSMNPVYYLEQDIDITWIYKKLDRLMLTNPGSVSVTKHGTIRYVRYGFLLVFSSNFVRYTHRF